MAPRNLINISAFGLALVLAASTFLALNVLSPSDRFGAFARTESSKEPTPSLVPTSVAPMQVSEPQRRSAAVGSHSLLPQLDAVTLTVLSRADHSPLRHAEARVTRGGGAASRRFRSGDGSTTQGTAGVIAIPLVEFVGDAEQFLVVSAPGHCTCTLPWIAGTEHEEVLLEVGSTLTVLAIDESGAPLGGVPLRLYPDRDDTGAPRLDDRDLVGRTDEAGMVHWDRLSPGRIYRYAADEGSVIAYEPLTVFEDARTPDGGLHVQSGIRHERTSGPVALRPGEHCQVTCVVARLSAVVGCLPDARPEEGSRIVVKIMHRSAQAVDAARGYGSTELEVVGYASADGRFRFEGLRPGRKVLKASWEERGQHVHFAKEAFVLKKGETVDLGKIERLRGGTLRVTTVACSEDGEPLAVTGDVQPTRRLSLDVLSRDREGRRSTAIQGVLAIGLGETLWLHGLRSGECRLELGTSLHDVSDASIWRMPDARTVSVPSTMTLDLPVVIPSRLDVTVVTQFPAGLMSRPCSVEFIPLSGRGAARSVTCTPSGAADSIGFLELSPARFQVMARATSSDATSAGHSGELVGSCVAALDLNHLHVEIMLKRAAHVYGGEPAAPSSGAGGHVAVGLQLNSAFRDAAWTHPRVPLDDRGRLSISGLIPHARYVTSEGVAFTAGPPGSSQQVELTARR